MPELIPAILAKSAQEAETKFRVAEGLVSCVQLDVMDGHFVPNRTWADAEAFLTLGTDLEVELHLMVSDPLPYLQDWKRVSHVKRVLWHVEIPTFHAGVIQICEQLGWECGLALSPQTPLDRIKPYLEMVDEVLILGVKPGFSGQDLIPSTLDTIDAVKRLRSDIVVGFDGGVTLTNASSLIQRGVDRLCVASAIFGQTEPKQALESFKEKVA